MWSIMNDASYKECFVAFLDILGFGQLVEESVNDPHLFAQLGQITTCGVLPTSGMKMTSLGPCPMQIRAFSDSIVAFTPTNDGNQNTSNPLAQLCFVVRYLHDRILKLGACIRGGIAVGLMYWHASWGVSTGNGCMGQQASPPLTFGPGLNKAYQLESKKAVNPRILVHDDLRASEDARQAWPFGNNGLRLREFWRADDDDRVFLDVLNSRVTRIAEESLKVTSGGFTIEWRGDRPSAHDVIIDKADQIARAGISANGTCSRVRTKYEWLKNYVEKSR